MLQQSKLRVGLLATLTVLVSACSSEPNNEKLSAHQVDTAKALQKSAVDVNQYAAHKMVCDPFGTQPDPRSNVGLKGELFYIPKDTMTKSQLNSLKVQDYFDQGVKSNQSIFLSQLNVPTRTFDKGFATEAGDSVKDDNGNLLDEWFAMRFKTVLRLGAEEEEGMYQIAALSDDGSIVRIQKDGQWKAIINNDGLHSTRLGCGSEPVHFSRDTEYLAEIDYFQGPRMHISMILMKRKLPADGSQDALCGVQSNSLYFDYTKDSAPAKGYKDLLARGWLPLSRDNYALQNQAVWNPCLSAEKPVISNFRVLASSSTSITLAWHTNVPATSQVLFSRIGSYESDITVSDNFLRTQHELVLPVRGGQTYVLQAVSTAGNLGRAISEPIEQFVDLD